MKHLLLTTIAASVYSRTAMNYRYSGRVFSTFAAVVILLYGGITKVNADPLTYEVIGDIVTIKDCKGTASGALAIPSIYEGKPITSIWKCTSLTSVTIPNSVTSIGWDAFARCTGLKRITFEGEAPSLETNVFSNVSGNARIFITQDATGFGETFEGLPVIIQKKLEIITFRKSASPFTIRFESKSGSTYIIETSQDLRQRLARRWRKIGEVQGTGSSAKFTDWREALFQKQYYRVKMVE